MGNEFDDFGDVFDDLSDFGANNEDDFGDLFSDDDNFRSDEDDYNEDYGEHDSKDVYKSSAVMVAVGIGIVIFGIVISILINKAAGKGKLGNKEGVQSDIGVNNSILNNENQTNSWLKFEDHQSDILMNDVYINATFTVTKVEHYVSKATSSGDNLIVKTNLLGNISGFDGTYRLDIPYTKGIKVKSGNTFKVRVQHGEYQGKTVIGDIKY